MAGYSRRQLLAASGAAAAGGAAAGAAGSAALDALSRRHTEQSPEFGARGTPSWGEVRALFPIASDWIDMSAMLITSHATPVAHAIQRHREGLDGNPVVYLEQNNRRLLSAALEAAARYLGGIDAGGIALTDSTTAGVGLVYNGLRIDADHEILTTDQEYYVTHESLRLAASRSGASVRRIKLYDEDELARITAQTLVERIIREIRPATRALALTWVHSSTGLAIPVAEIAAELSRINATRDTHARVLLCVDGVHAVGIKDISFQESGCDFLMSGCHKWLFGPRGTGIVAGSAEGWRRITPTIPSFFDVDAYGRWMRNTPAAAEATTAAAFMPGGFKSFEHQWALSIAFDLHGRIGKARIAQRTMELTSQLKEGLATMPHIRLLTPRQPELSAGIVSFDVAGKEPGQVVEFLRTRKVVASVAPYAVPHVRLSPSVRNTPQEVDAVLAHLRGLATS